MNVELLSELGCGRATAYPFSNKIITTDDKVHVCWLDAVSIGFRVRIKTMDRATGTWSQTYTVGEAYDNHGGPALTIDSLGYLHMVYYPHHQRFCYSRSKRPYDASEWEDEQRFGSQCSYPALVCGKDDTLFLACRESFTEQPYHCEKPWVVNLYTKKVGEPWSEARTLLSAERNGYANFNQNLCWGPDQQTLHLSVRILDGRQFADQKNLAFAWGEHMRSHTIAYLKSRDFGETWEKSDGTPVEIPVVSTSIDVVEQNYDLKDPSQGYDSSAIAVDHEDTPYILYTEQLECGRLVLARPEAGEWHRSEIWREIPASMREWNPISTCGMCFLPDGRLRAALGLMPRKLHGESDWGHESARTAFVTFDTHGKVVDVEIYDPTNVNMPLWLPTLERPTGFNAVSDPAMLITGGERGEGLQDKNLNNEVLFLQSRR